MHVRNNRFIIIRQLKNRNQNDNKEEIDKQNQFNQKILDSILDDNEDQFAELLTETCNDLSKINRRFKMTNYKMPEFLGNNPTYASVCACFGAEKCFNTISMLLPSGTSSEEMKKLDDSKRSPIHFACIGGCLNIIRELDQAGYDLNCKDYRGFLPSHYAAMFGHCDVIKYLWTKGGNVLTFSSMTLFDDSISPIELACLYGSLDIVKFICETVILGDPQKKLKFSDLFANTKMPTPLHYACIGGHDNIVEYFLSDDEYIKCQINSLDQNSRNPLLCACHNGSLSCIKTFLNCSKTKINLNMKGRVHLPLVDAAEGGYLDVVQFLVKQKGVNIQQETSRKVSPLYAAIKNDHLNVVKFLIQNGAAKNLDKTKIGWFVYTAFEEGSLELVRYLDGVLEIPYFDECTPLNTKCIDPPMDIHKPEKVTFGDRYMKEACFNEDEKMVDFLLSKNCTLDSINPSLIIRNKAFDFLDVLIDKGLSVANKDYAGFAAPIVTMVNCGNYFSVKNLIEKGATLNSEIITNYRLIQSTSGRGDFKLFEYLMSFNPKLSNDELIVSLKHSIIQYNAIEYQKNEQLTNDCLNIIELILSKMSIDLNETMCNDHESFISFVANRRCLSLLDLFEKHGADFKNCALNFDLMTDEEDLPVLKYFKEKGCSFQNALYGKQPNRKSSKTPLSIMLSRYVYLRYLCIDNLILIMDYSTPKNILTVKSSDNNIIDVFVNYNSCKGILKAYQLTKTVFYPLSMARNQYEQWIKNTNEPELINLVFSKKT